MARIEGVSAKEAGLKMRVAHYFTRRELVGLTQRDRRVGVQLERSMMRSGA